MENNKNIWLLPTNEPSRLSDCHNNKLHLDDVRYLRNYQHIYITSDEEIKDKTWVWDKTNNRIVFLLSLRKDSYNKNVNFSEKYSKIILTTDIDLIDDGIEQISENTLLKIIEHINSGKKN